MRSRSLRRDLAQTMHVDGHAHRLHGRQHPHQRELDVAVEGLEPELAETLPLLGRETPGEHRPGGGQRLVPRTLSDVLLVDAGELEEVALGPFGLEQVGRDVRVEGRVGRRPP